MNSKPRPKRVLHITFNMDCGGTEQVIRQLIIGMDSNRVASQVVCIDGFIGQIGHQLIAQGVSIKMMSRRPGLDRRVISELRRLIKKADIDVIHCHQYTPFCYGALASIGTGAKVIFTEHGRFHPDRYTWKRRVVNQVLIRIADRITCISSATRSALAEYEWIPEKRVQVIYNGLKAPKLTRPEGSVREQYGIHEETFVLGTIARLDSIKNQKMMIAALADLQSYVPNAVLVIAGEGPEKEQLEKLAIDHCVIDSVHFAGFVTDIAGYLDAYDVFLLTSFSEGTSMTLLEAMAMGTPIVATSVGGSQEVIDNGESGILIPSDDHAALVTALRNLANDPALCKKLANQAMVDFNLRFNVEGMCDAYSVLYEESAQDASSDSVF